MFVPAVLTIATAADSSETRTTLVAVILLLGAVLVGLVALLVALRRRAPSEEPAETPAPTPMPRPMPRVASPPVRQTRRRAPSVPSAGGDLAVASSATSSSGMVCPTCRSEYQGHTYCIRDARRLVPAEEMLAGGRGPGGMCVACRRAFEPGLRRCPHDGGDVVPAALFWAMRGKKSREPQPITGVNAKVCPVCRQRADLAARFCGHDGAELVVVN
ncbi:MAG TPA: hypothetical protein VL463_16980 [Kofleriaceae bacterium]|nr:hypothetical protein [Kofleriaceae bacterium]